MRINVELNVELMEYLGRIRFQFNGIDKHVVIPVTERSILAICLVGSSGEKKYPNESQCWREKFKRVTNQREIAAQSRECSHAHKCRHFAVGN